MYKDINASCLDKDTREKSSRKRSLQFQCKSGEFLNTGMLFAQAELQTRGGFFLITQCANSAMISFGNLASEPYGTLRPGDFEATTLRPATMRPDDVEARRRWGQATLRPDDVEARRRWGQICMSNFPKPKHWPQRRDFEANVWPQSRDFQANAITEFNRKLFF